MSLRRSLGTFCLLLGTLTGLNNGDKQEEVAPDEDFHLGSPTNGNTSESIPATKHSGELSDDALGFIEKSAKGLDLHPSKNEVDSTRQDEVVTPPPHNPPPPDIMRFLSMSNLDTSLPNKITTSSPNGDPTLPRAADEVPFLTAKADPKKNGLVELILQVGVGQLTEQQKVTLIQQLAMLLNVLDSDITIQEIHAYSDISTAVLFYIQNGHPYKVIKASDVAQVLRLQLLKEKPDILLFKVLRVDTAGIKHRSTEHNSSLMISESEFGSDQDTIFSREKVQKENSRNMRNGSIKNDVSFSYSSKDR